MAEHSRGLQDVGLAKYAGSKTVIIWVVAFLVPPVLAYLLQKKYCKFDGTSENAACIAATILFILGTLGLGALLLFGPLALIGGSSHGSASGGSDSSCPDGKFYFDWESDEWRCADELITPSGAGL
jgi:hypothetical protein